MIYTFEKTIKIKWLVYGYEDYGFSVDKKLYNCKTTREKKQCYNGGMIGYWIDRKFISVRKLRTLLYIPKEEVLPF